MSDSIEEINLHPDAHFKHPDEVLDHDEWSPSQKITLLMNWKDNILEMLESDNENMLDTDHLDNGALLDILSEINEAIRSLKAQQTTPNPE